MATEKRDINAALAETLKALKSYGRRGREWMLEHYDTNLSAAENIALAVQYFSQIVEIVENDKKPNH